MEFLRKYSPLFTFGILAIAIVAFLIGQFRDVRTEIKDVRIEIKEVRTELKAEIAQVRIEIKEVRTELKAQMDRLSDKMDTLILSNRKPAVRPR